MFGADRSVVTRLKVDISDYRAKFRAAKLEARDLAGEVDKSATKQRRAWQDTGVAVGGTGLAIAAGVGVAIKSFADFDKAMSRASAGTNASVTQMDALRQAALKAGADTQFSATEAADAITELGKAGVEIPDILGGGLKGALDLAAAGELNVAQAAEIAATAMSQFGLKGKDIPHVADLLAAGAGKAQGSVQDMATALKYVGPQAKALGLSIDDTVASLALLAKNAGLVGEQAGTGLRGVFASLQGPSKLAGKQLAELGINVYDSAGKFVGMEGAIARLQAGLGGLTDKQRDQALTTIFGRENLSAAITIINGGTEAYARMRKEVTEANFAQVQARKLTDNLSGDIERLTGSLQTLAISSGSGVNTSLRSFVQAADGAVDTVSKLPAPVQSAVVEMGLLTAATLLFGGAALSIVPKVTAAKASLIELTGSATAAKTALATLGKAFAVLAIADVAVHLGNFLGQVRAADVPTNKLADAMSRFGETGKLAGAGLDQFDTGFGPLTDHADSTSEALDKFGKAAHKALDQSMTARSARWLSLGTDLSTFREQAGDLDHSLAELARNGHPDEAVAAFDRLAAAAKKQGLPIASLRKEFPELADAVTKAKEAQDGGTESIKKWAQAQGLSAVEAEKTAKRIADAEAAAQKATAKAFATDTDVLGSFKPDAGAKEIDAATKRVEKAKEKLDRALQKPKTRDVSAARGDVADAQAALDEARQKRATGTLEGQYKERIRLVRDFNRDIVAATREGLDPSITARLLQEGPEKAGPVLQAILGDHSGRMIKMVNDSETELSRLNTLAVEQARLTARAVASDTDELAHNLGKAMAIAAEKAREGANATAESIAKALHLPPKEVNDIAHDFGITVTSKVKSAVRQQGPIDVKVNARARFSLVPRVTAPYVELPGRASGGPMYGPGGPRGDRIPAMLSDREWVIQASSSQRAGDAALAMLNAGRLAEAGRLLIARSTPPLHRRDGGPVWDKAAATAGARAQAPSLSTVREFVSRSSLVRDVTTERAVPHPAAVLLTAPTRAPQQAQPTPAVPARTVAPEVIPVKVPVQETHTRVATFTGDIHLPSARPDDVADWGTAAAAAR